MWNPFFRHQVGYLVNRAYTEAVTDDIAGVTYLNGELKRTLGRKKYWLLVLTTFLKIVIVVNLIVGATLIWK